MPGARCTRGLVCNMHKECAHEHTGTAGAFRHSLRNGFTAYGALSPETNSSCLHRRRIEGLIEARLGFANLRRLDTSHGCQDHTVLPYASAPFVCALPCSLTEDPPCEHLARPTLPRPPHPAPTFVTIAIRPSYRDGMAGL